MKKLEKKNKDVEVKAAKNLPKILPVIAICTGSRKDNNLRLKLVRPTEHRYK